MLAVITVFHVQITNLKITFLNPKLSKHEVSTSTNKIAGNYLAYCPPATPEPKTLIALNKLVLKTEARFAADS